MAYFSNGSEGEVLEDQCADCPLGYGWNDPAQKHLFDPEKIPLPCPTAFVQFNFNYDQCRPGNDKLRDAMRVLIDDNGECQTRKLLLKIRRDESQ
jgi:hypothetical protein